MECSVQYEITRLCVVTHSDNKSRSYGFMNRYAGILNPGIRNPMGMGIRNHIFIYHENVCTLVLIVELNVH